MRRASLALILLFATSVPMPAAAESLKEFLASCQTNADDCDNQIVAVHVTSEFISKRSNSPLGYCYPPEAKKTDEALATMLTTIKSWLKAQRDRNDQSASDVIKAAYKTLYPCS
jgi:hypothetical protein